MGHLYSQLALTPAFNEDGTYSSATDHPLVDMDKRSGYNKNNKKYINAQFVADWNLPWVQGLSLGTMLNYRVSDEFKKNSTHVLRSIIRMGSTIRLQNQR